MGLRLAFGFGLGALAIPAASLAQTGTADAVRNWSAITECGSITDAGRRLACMDDVLRSAGIATAPAPALPAPPPQAAAEPSRAATPRTPVQTQPRSEPQAVTTTIRSVQEVGYQRLLVTTAEGAMWEQTEAETFTTSPKAGDAFSVQPAALGSFRCRIAQSSRYRCRQVN